MKYTKTLGEYKLEIEGEVDEVLKVVKALEQQDAEEEKELDAMGALEVIRSYCKSTECESCEIEKFCGVETCLPKDWEIEE